MAGSLPKKDLPPPPGGKTAPKTTQVPTKPSTKVRVKPTKKKEDELA